MCDDFGDWEDFAFIGGLFGLIEEEDEEERKFLKEMEEEWDEPLDD